LAPTKKKEEENSALVCYVKMLWSADLAKFKILFSSKRNISQLGGDFMV
jgi:hypothetical protein